MGIIGLTMGDPAGVGPEICLKALTSGEKFKYKYVIFGSCGILNYYKKILNIKVPFNVINDIKNFKDGFINIFDVVNLSINDIKIGKVDGKCGDAAFQYIKTAIEMALKKEIDAVVTAPLNKEALHIGGHNFDGHTEIFATLTGTKKYAMMLTGGKLRVIHVSTHCALSEACRRVKKDRVLDVINIANVTLKRMGIKNPAIAVAGLNPHAGEAGLFGREEIDEIIPAVDEAKKNGLNVIGPVPPDTVFLKGMKGEYDIVVAMYHDQGHIPLKLLGFESGVNITAGLPIIRTSVDHGTAFDIAGKGIANCVSMIEAMKSAEMFIRI